MLLLAVLVLLVRDRFHPCHVLALRIVPGNRHLNHSLVGSCAMEMFDAFRTYNHIAFFQDAHWFSIDARTAFSFNNDQNLSDRVCVPERSGAWFKNYICTGYRHPGNRFRQRDDLDFTGKYLVASFNALDGIAPFYQLITGRNLFVCCNSRPHNQQRGKKSRNEFQHDGHLYSIY